MVLHLTVFWHSECPSSPPPRVEEKGNQHWQYIFLIHMHSKEPTHGLRNTHPQPTLFHIHPTLPHSHGNHRAVAASAARDCTHWRLGADMV